MQAIKVSVKDTPREDARVNALIVGIYEKTNKLPVALKQLDKVSSGCLKRLIESGDYNGKSGRCAWLYPPDAPFDRLLAVGLGSAEKFNAEAFRRATGAAAREVRRMKAPRVAVALPEGKGGDFPDAAELARAAVEGFVMGAYRFLEFKTRVEDNSPIKSLTVLCPERKSELAAVRREAGRGLTVAEGVNLARDLVNTPGGDMPPEALAREARRLARKHGLKCSVMGVPQLRKMKMNGILAVGSGSSRPPRLVTLEYGPKGGVGAKKPLVLVGKGITFDSGGISIKPSGGMEKMKYDMSGAAAAMATAVVAARQNWKRPVVAILPLAENLPGPKAYRPGDVIKMASGARVEVISTDAEGRMILADALHYSKRYKPEAVADIATLTGACTVALGHEAIGLMGNDPELVRALLEAGEASGERAWQLPLWEEYEEQLKSDVADVKNAGGRPAGTITAGTFLKKFVGDMKWAHLDIAGTAWSDRDWAYRVKGATGVGVRILAQWGENF